jgi:hypothetical protein
MAGFTYKLEHEDGTPADPPTFRTAVPTAQGGKRTICAGVGVGSKHLLAQRFRALAQ